ncbi:MAG: hypothetical protein CMJ19_16775, partial [Phycisphaeraceae bacterium]|nr:hypothetical protein [Phycisphaeraceae bacterium]
MTTDNYDDNLILGYIEDELTAEQKAAFEQTLATDPRLASLVKSMKQDRDMLSDLDQVTAPMELGDYVSAQLERQMLLGPLPERRKHNPAVRSTPQARSHARTMRIFAYGALAAMFMVIIGLMINHTGTQSLIHRTENMAFESQIHKQQPAVAMDMNQADRQPDAIDRLLAEPIVLPKTKTELEMQPQPPEAPEISTAPMPETLALNLPTDKRETSAVGGIAKLDWDESESDQANVVSGRGITTESSVIADQPVVAMRVPKAVARNRASGSATANRSPTAAITTAPVSEGVMSGYVAAPAASAPSPAAEELKKNSPTMSRLAMGDDELYDKKEKSDSDDTAPSITNMITGDFAASENGSQPVDSQPLVTTSPTSPEKTKTVTDVAVVVPESSPIPPLVADTDPAMNQLATPPPRAKLLAESAAPSMPSAKPLPRRLRDVAGVRSMTIMPQDDADVTTSNTITQTAPVCIIHSQQPQQTVIQITQWALRNKVQIIAPVTDKAQRAKESQPKNHDKSAPQPVTKPAAKSDENADPLRQVITLNIPANQVPVLVQWLNGQTSQSNNWIAPLPQANTGNDAYQRL